MNKNWLLLPVIALALTACETSHSTGRGYNAEKTTPEQDRAVVGRIKEIIIEDPNFSPRAKQIEVIAVDGVVTLRGQVGSDDESSNIESKIKNINGVKKVDNQLTTAPVRN